MRNPGATVKLTPGVWRLPRGHRKERPARRGARRWTLLRALPLLVATGCASAPSRPVSPPSARATRAAIAASLTAGTPDAATLAEAWRGRYGLESDEVLRALVAALPEAPAPPLAVGWAVERASRALEAGRPEEVPRLLPSPPEAADDPWTEARGLLVWTLAQRDGSDAAELGRGLLLRRANEGLRASRARSSRRP